MTNKKLLAEIKESVFIPIHLKKCSFHKITKHGGLVLIASKRRKTGNHPFEHTYKPNTIEL
ncbi:MAG: hypothetical protein ACI8ZM_004732 [Crocinitomix sp.]|jgi:hypothetical protein